MQCTVCGSSIPEDITICPDCGTEIGSQKTPSGPSAAPPERVVLSPVSSSTGLTRLLLKRGGALTGDEFVISGRVVVGRFDTETGPVDVDFGSLPEAPYISRHHAEIYRDASGQWFVKDLGSTSGTFLWVSGSNRPQRLSKDQPTPLNDEDEIAFANARFVFRTQ